MLLRIAKHTTNANEHRITKPCHGNGSAPSIIHWLTMPDCHAAKKLRTLLKYTFLLVCYPRASNGLLGISDLEWKPFVLLNLHQDWLFIPPKNATDATG